MFGCNSILARKERKQGPLSKQKSFKYQNFNINSLGMYQILMLFHSVDLKT